MSVQAVRPGRIWYLLPVLMFLVATILALGIVLGVVNHPHFQGFQLEVPGSRQFQIDRPGRYVLWNETRTIYQGTTFSTTSDIPSGVHFEVKQVNTGKTVPMVPDFGATVTTTSTARESIGTFDLTEPGQYQLSVTGNFPKRIFYFRDSMLSGAPVLVLAAGIGVLGFIGSVALALLIFFKRSSVRRQMAH